MSLERVEKLIEDIKETIGNATLTDEEKLDAIVDLVDIYRGPPTPVVQMELLKHYLNAIILGSQRDSGVRH